MAIANRLKRYLDDAGVRYDTVAHPRTATASETADAAHLPGDCVAKSVVIHHEEGYVLAVVPSSHRVDLTLLQEKLHRRLGLASEREINDLFDDCETGAAPPVGAAYDVSTMLDDSLNGKTEIWFEGGDHRTLIHITGSEFDRLMQDARHESFSYRA
ncbi:MAG: aminoacyl-tRNA deacylase [Parvularculaceae bacterium]